MRRVRPPQRAHGRAACGGGSGLDPRLVEGGERLDESRAPLRRQPFDDRGDLLMAPRGDVLDHEPPRAGELQQRLAPVRRVEPPVRQPGGDESANHAHGGGRGGPQLFGQSNQLGGAPGRQGQGHPELRQCEAVFRFGQGAACVLRTAPPRCFMQAF